MDRELREEIKQSLKKSLYKHVSKFVYTSSHPLDELIPKERKIRSLVGGLETSMGTTVWEPIAKTIAKSNGFEVVLDKILKPDPMPETLAIELGSLITLRENQATWITADECVKRIRTISKAIDHKNIDFIPSAAGTGVDILLKKNDEYFAFDTKTVKPNVGSIKSFNKQLLEWYAYSIFKNPDIKIKCMIAYPYNPYSDNFWSHTPHSLNVLQPKVDALVQNEFWDFLSGKENTYQNIIDVLSELNNEGFGSELSVLIDNINLDSRAQIK